MRIEEGKYYRTRDGRKVGPMMEFESELFPGLFIQKRGDGFVWGEDGTCYVYMARASSDHNLVSEWEDQTGPIVTETVRRIKPGVYGLLKVGAEISIPDCDRPDQPPPREIEAYLTKLCLNASDWRELARVALEIAEYLDAQ